jgi:predicted DsbA family dithiol-disulfide isomerase
MDLEELFAGRGLDVPRLMGRLRGIALGLGLPWGERTRTYNTRGAQELGAWAEERGRGAEFRRGVFLAYFAEGRNVARAEELTRLAGEAGLDPAEARRVLREGRFGPVVDEAWRRARRLGISAVPTHAFRGRLDAGYLPWEALDRFLSGAAERSAGRE